MGIMAVIFIEKCRAYFTGLELLVRVTPKVLLSNIPGSWDEDRSRFPQGHH